MSKKNIALHTAVLVCLVAPCVSLAQEEREGNRETYPPPDRVEPEAVATDYDSAFATWVIADNQAQLDIARFASARSRNEAVLMFLDDLISAHRSLLRDLGDIAGAEGRSVYSIRAAPPPSRTEVHDRQRIRATASDEVREKIETRPVHETKSGAPNTGNETGPTGTRARDVRQGETGTDNARTITEPVQRSPRLVESTGPAGVGSRGRTATAGTTGDEVRARDRRLDTFDRVGSLPVTEQNRRSEDDAEEKRVRLRYGAESSARLPGDVPESRVVMADIARQRVELVRRELGRSRGDAFDVAFLQQQIAAHLYSLSLVRGLKGHVGSELQEVLDDAEDLNWSHMSRAKELLNELDRAPSQINR